MDYNTRIDNLRKKFNVSLIINSYDNNSNTEQVINYLNNSNLEEVLLQVKEVIEQNFTHIK